MNNKNNATFVAVWNGGTTIQKSCFFDEKANKVFGIEPTDPHIFSMIMDEYVVFKNEIIKNFNFG